MFTSKYMHGNAGKRMCFETKILILLSVYTFAHLITDDHFYQAGILEGVQSIVSLGGSRVRDSAQINQLTWALIKKIYGRGID